MALTERQGICISSKVACFLASIILSRSRVASISSAFESGSFAGMGHPIASREYQKDTLASISLQTSEFISSATSTVITYF